MRSFVVALCLCAAVTACTGSGGTGLPPLPESTATAPGRPGQAPPPGAPTPLTANRGPVSASNPSTAIVDVNRSNTAVLGPNSPPPTTFENSCAPAPYLFQSKAGYEAVRVKDCKNDQLVYLPTSAQTQIDIYVLECQRRCNVR